MIQNTNCCVGCGACKNTCPVDAISIGFNENGFYAPFVAESKCVKCGKCIKVCPAIEFSSENSHKPVCYVAYASDEERKNSSSGAIFPILAKYVLSKGGYVCGVSWNKNWEAEHIIIDNENDLHKIRFSKYVQATTGNCFSEIKKLLEDNKLVLFSGTPCQNAGLIKFLGKDYDNLITVDLLCHGSPSAKVWQDYLELNFDKEKITAINFRKKDEGWFPCSDGSYNSRYSQIKTLDGKCAPIGVYYEAFLKSQLSNDACLDCKYRFIPRPADFTLGDFWNFYNSEYNDKKGLSAVLLNNKKAKDIFAKIVPTLEFCKKIELKGHWEKLEIYNTSKATVSRTNFFEKYKKGGDLNKMLNQATEKKYDVGLVSFFNVMNYGSVLVSYASKKLLENLGYSVLMIDRDFNGFDLQNNVKNLSREFAQKHYEISKLYRQGDDPRELNDLCDTFVIASDTMWWDAEYAGDFAWLDFVRSDKRKLSLSTSFAHKEPAMDNNQRAKRKILYKRFHSLSVREASGVDILKNIFDVEGTHLYDPTLISDKQIFEDLANASKRTEKGFVFAYMLDLTPEKELVAKYVADKLNLKLKLISNMRYQGGSSLIDENNVAIEDFVYFCKNADFILSDSFHGTCFSTIFEKPFISLINAWRGLERYQIFIDNGLGNNLFDNIDSVYNINLADLKPDYTAFKDRMEVEKSKAINWLKDAMEKPLPLPSKEDLLYDYIYNSKMENLPKDVTEIKKTFLEKVFSVKNEYSNGFKRKVITVLGMVIKIRIKGNKG